MTRARARLLTIREERVAGLLQKSFNTRPKVETQWICRSFALAHGVSKFTVPRLRKSWRHPRGWQAVVRVSDDGARALVVCRAFEGAPEMAEVPLPAGGGWRIVERFPDVDAGNTGEMLRWHAAGDFTAGVLLLTR